ncbi:uncharacterized protein EKO05_0008587 [Ascochyta rabiei]|uniref:Uncharacterized protein n=1 Tax=Didymella rabiei TaxID=5454 RepID=A0A163FYD1_DIDRA|nr:uncharacterized protein EKO05_0008587 [Ascochyta rabiei]KZM24594.1 hypothetical protein ST47_g4335 [Ascochyta rabiei]UPX18283.1 hypothetical protein EKO05_0008587 [Ascochyta rabiei]
MSGPELPDAPTTRSLKRKDFSKDDQDELEELDRIFERTKAVVPPNPYILSTPSMDPYRYHSQQEAHAWMLGRLWRHDEEHMQYRTYLYREPCQDCFELQAGEDDEPEPEPQQPERPRSQASQASNTASQAPKKKISLSAYKNKQANGVLTPTPGSKLASPSSLPSKPPPAHANGAKEPEKQQDSVQKTAVSSSQKQPTAEIHNGRKPQNDRQGSNRSQLPPRPPAPPTKPTDTDDARPIDKSSPSNSTPHGLPPMLSPVHEPLSNPYGLPSILSPTLPSTIQAELDRLEQQRSRAVSSASASSTEPKSQTLSVPKERERPQLADKTVKTEQRIRSVSVSGKSPFFAPTVTVDDKPPSLIVKLKFSKGKAATVKQVLRLPPKRPLPEKKERQDPPKQSPVKIRTKVVEEPGQKKAKPTPKIAARRPDTSTTSTSTPTPTPTPSAKPAVPAMKTAEKRPRTDDDASLAVPLKRQRALSAQDRPNTPTPQAASSPALSNKASAQKNLGQYVTPKKDHKAVNMLRTGSSESQDATPGRSGGTPASSRPDARVAPTSAPLTGKKQADIALMAQTSMKLNQMGRALKHEATKILTDKGNKITKQDEKRAAVTNLECILSYMAAYYAQDLSLHLRNRAGEVEQTWKTLLPLCLSYARCTKDFVHLDGLRSYLSSVIASTICTCVAQRSSMAKAHDSPQDVTHAQLAREHTSLAENFALLSDHAKKMVVHYQEARIALPVEDIQTMYKKTWAGREGNAKLIKEPERISGARMSGPYFLPISNDTTPIQAVRFGLKFLGEYCEREGLNYSLRVNLSKPE